ncbi:MAG: SAF domain-containing protein [Candidatus Dormibacteria bacterium]
MRRKLAVAVGVFTFCAALAGFLLLGLQAQMGQERVLVSARNILAGESLQANTSFLTPGGALVHLQPAALADTFPESKFRLLQGAVALVDIPPGAVILRSDLAMNRGTSARQITLSLAFMPVDLSSGDRVDLLAVSGGQTGSAAAGADLCGSSGGSGCVAPLAESVLVIGVSAPAHQITIDVSPSKVAPWLLLDATQAIWAVDASGAACPGAEQAISNPQAALQAIAAAGASPVCTAVTGALGELP